MSEQGVSLNLEIKDELGANSPGDFDGYLKSFNNMVLYFLEAFYEPSVLEGKIVELSVVFVDDEKITSLNSEYRKKENTTDVLTFPVFENLRETSEWKGFPHISLGEIFICYPQAQRQAPKHSVDLHSEVIHLFAHGFLHIMGFDHEIDEREEKLMESWEKRLVEHVASF